MEVMAFQIGPKTECCQDLNKELNGSFSELTLLTKVNRQALLHYN